MAKGLVGSGLGKGLSHSVIITEESRFCILWHIS